MKKHNLLLVLLLFFSITQMSAQSEKPNFCGTAPQKSIWLKNYQKNPSAHKTMKAETIYVPLTVHVVGYDDGSGYFGINSVFAALCTLNKDFEDANVVFYLKDGINYIQETAFNVHETVTVGGQFMLANNIEGTLNCYIVNDPAGNCGYSLPYAGVALGTNCASPGDHTWAHEIGHFCSLPHPFLGWEGGVSWDNSVSHNYNNPAPLTVTYNYTDFKDQVYTDTLIIDTTMVEKVDRSNCADAADGFCDTNPDYLSGRWNCDDNEESSIQTDPNGEKFKSDGALIMSYSDDNCARRFSPEQISAMRANIIEVKGYYQMDGDIETEFISGSTILADPIEDTEVPYQNITLSWEPLENAKSYIIYVSRYSNFSNLDAKITTAETSTVIESLKKNKKYYWKVYAYSDFAFCNEFSEAESFMTTESTSNHDIESITSYSVYPKVLKSNTNINFVATLDKNDSFDATIYDLSGKKIVTYAKHLSIGTNHWELPTTNLQSGLYLLSINSKNGVLTEKIVIQN